MQENINLLILLSNQHKKTNCDNICVIKYIYILIRMTIFY